MIKTLEDALKRISELEEENSLLRMEVEILRSKKAAGRKNMILRGLRQITILL